METPLTLLQLSIQILQFVKSIINDADEVNYMAFCNVLKEDGEAKKYFPDFLYKIKECGVQLQDDDDLSEAVLMEATTIRDEYFATTHSNPNTLATVNRFHPLSKWRY